MKWATINHEGPFGIGESFWAGFNFQKFILQTKRDLEQLVDELNAGRPQCPVGLNTLVIPRKLSTAHQDLNQPYVYLNCGHVQGKYHYHTLLTRYSSMTLTEKR